MLIILTSPYASMELRGADERLMRMCGSLGIIVNGGRIWSMGGVEIRPHSLGAACDCCRMTVLRWVTGVQKIDRAVMWLAGCQSRRRERLERFTKDEFMMEKFGRRTAQRQLCEFLLAWGLAVRDGAIWVGPIEVTQEAVARAAGCDRQTVSSAVETIDGDDELRRYVIQCSNRI